MSIRISQRKLYRRAVSAVRFEKRLREPGTQALAEEKTNLTLFALQSNVVAYPEKPIAGNQFMRGQATLVQEVYLLRQEEVPFARFTWCMQRVIISSAGFSGPQEAFP